MVETLIIKKTADLLFSALDKLFKRNTLRANEKQSGILISEAIQELLGGSPNLNIVRSKLAKAESISSSPSEELMSAREMLQKVEKSGARKTLVSPRRKHKKKVSKVANKSKAGSVSVTSRKKTASESARKKTTKKSSKKR